jgi:nitroreductase
VDVQACDELLSTTRSVRYRLDLTRPVDRGVITDCLRLAIQAPTGGNSQGWRWIVVTDPELRLRLAELYRDIATPYLAAGLDQDYMRRPFGPMPALLSVAEEVSKMHAVCVRCRGAAHYSQRVSGGDAQVEVGDSSYEARCRGCYEAYRAQPVEEPEVQLTIPQPVVG